MQLENIILSEVIQSQKNTHGMHSLISCYLPKSSEYPRYNSQITWSSRRSNTKCGWFSSSEKGNKVLIGVNMELKYRAETEEKVILRLFYLVIHPIYSHQTPTLLRMPRNAYWQEPDMAVSWEALPVPHKYRGRCSQQTIGLSSWSLMEELEKELKELKRFATS